MNLDNQQAYWDKVAAHKTFSHPVNIELLFTYCGYASTIVDVGCGYGRTVRQLLTAGFTNVHGYDTSLQLIERGLKQQLPIVYIDTPADMPVADDSVDCILLFAVLTCIPSNKGQRELIQLLHSKLRAGGILYISDYYLQENETSKSRYTYLDNDTDNYGVFTLPEGATFRHHSKTWMDELLKDFDKLEELEIEVKTMNGNSAKGVQLLVRK